MRITSGVMDMTNLKYIKYGAKKRSLMYQPTVGEELRVVAPDQNIRTEPEESKRRRTIILRKENDSWGFTIHTYGIHHKKSDKLEILTYVDYVSPNGPAYVAGMRAGDVILAVNGISMEAADHASLVNYIKTCPSDMRMIVLFENCCHKVELHSRYIQLQRVLRAKIFELRSLEHQEAHVLDDKTSLDHRRLSLASSSSSSVCGFWDDRLSLRPEYDICPLRGTSPVPPPHNSRDVARSDPQDILRSSFGSFSFRSGRPCLDSSFRRNTGSLDRADLRRQKRPISLNLNRPVSGYDLKFPAIEELDMKPHSAPASEIPSVSERVRARSSLSPSASCSSFRGYNGRMPRKVSPLAGGGTHAQRNPRGIHRCLTDPGTMAIPQIKLNVPESHKSEQIVLAIGGASGSPFSRSSIYRSSLHKLSKGSKLKRSLSHVVSPEFKGSPTLLSIKPLRTDSSLGLLSPGDNGAMNCSCTRPNCLRYARNLSGRNEDHMLGLTNSPLIDNAFLSPTCPFPGPTPVCLTPGKLISSNDAQVPIKDKFACNGTLLSPSTNYSYHDQNGTESSPCDLCNKVEAASIRSDRSRSKRDPSDCYSMFPSVTSDMDNWFLAGGAMCGKGRDRLTNGLTPRRQQKRFVFYSDLNNVRLDFLNENDEETAL